MFELYRTVKKQPDELLIACLVIAPCHTSSQQKGNPFDTLQFPVRPVHNLPPAQLVLFRQIQAQVVTDTTREANVILSAAQAVWTGQKRRTICVSSVHRLADQTMIILCR